LENKSSKQEKYEKITFEKAKEMMDKNDDCLIIDVREESEYVTGHADGALLLPVDDIDEKSASRVIPTKNTPVMLYCRSGSRSCLAAERLCKIGYKNVYDLGSLVGWPYGMTNGR
jgi:rhodanese-related sulfurtransferase